MYRTSMDNDYRVAFITTEYPPGIGGGSGKSSELIVNEVRKQGLTVDVFSLDGDSSSLEEVSKSHFRLPDGNYPRVPGVIGKSISAYRNLPSLTEYDIIHCYGSGHLPGVNLQTDVPVLSTFNNSRWLHINSQKYLKEGCQCYGFTQGVRNSRAKGEPYRYSILASLIVEAGKILSKRSDRITVQTEGMRRVLVNCGYPASKITIVPNLVDPLFCETDRVISPTESKKMIFVGRLVEEKGPKNVIQAFSNLPNTLTNDWELEIYGSGKLKDEIVQMAQKSDSSISISYIDYNELPEKAYGTSAALIHPSKWSEPFSRVWLEALATGTPIICSDNPSSRCVLDGIAEFFDPFKQTSLEKSLQKTIESPTLRNNMARLGKNRLDLYRPERIASRYIDEYNKLI